MQEELKEELETIIDLLIDWSLRSGEDVTIGTVTQPDYIAGLTLTPSDNYHVYKMAGREDSAE